MADDKVGSRGGQWTSVMFRRITMVEICVLKIGRYLGTLEARSVPSLKTEAP